MTGLSVDHNLIESFRGYDNEILGGTAVVGNPYFIDVSKDDYHLESNSPAIDSGSALKAPTRDFDLVVRPQGQSVTWVLSSFNLASRLFK